MHVYMYTYVCRHVYMWQHLFSLLQFYPLHTNSGSAATAAASAAAPEAYSLPVEYVLRLKSSSCPAVASQRQNQPLPVIAAQPYI